MVCPHSSFSPPPSPSPPSLSLSVPPPPHFSLPPFLPLGGDPSQLASLLQSLKSPTHSAAVQPASSTQPSLDQLRAWEEEKEALRRYPHTYTKLSIGISLLKECCGLQYLRNVGGRNFNIQV